MFLQGILAFSFHFLVAGVMSSECPSGFLRHHDSCYSLVRIQASWAEAAMYCKAVGAHLATVETEAEHLFLKGHLKQEDLTLEGKGVWIGGQDFIEPGTWRWRFNKEAISRFYWSDKQPNNMRHNNVVQQCLMIQRFNHLWNDEFCSGKEFFLCEVEAPQHYIVG